MRKILWVLCVFFLMTACAKERPVESEALLPEAPEEVEEEKVPTEESDKEKVLSQVREEVRVFDVVEHHDALNAGIREAMKNSDASELDEIATAVVTVHMDAHWRERVKDLLSEVNPNYETEDVDWVLDRISTSDLYELMVLYEVAFYKKQP
ncbi:hypothetical protein ACR6HW_10195 [Fusibacter sp. JL298sf-3]